MALIPMYGTALHYELQGAITSDITGANSDGPRLAGWKWGQLLKETPVPMDSHNSGAPRPPLSMPLSRMPWH